MPETSFAATILRMAALCYVYGFFSDSVGVGELVLIRDCFLTGMAAWGEGRMRGGEEVTRQDS